VIFRKLVAVAALCSMTAPAFGQTLRESAHNAARTESVQPKGSELGPMPKGLWWTGVGLLGAGGLTLLMGAAIKNGECDLDFESDCDDIGTGFAAPVPASCSSPTPNASASPRSRSLGTAAWS
jgi:hypothetical protein